MIPIERHSKHVGMATRRGAALALLVLTGAACGASDDAALDSSTTADLATTLPSTDPTTTTTTTTTTLSTPSTDAATVESSTTAAPSTTSTSTSSTTPTTAAPDDGPVQSIPEAVQGMWRITDAESVTADDCRQVAGFEQNYGQVLTVRADGFSYFESGGTLIEVIERDESRVDATFETTSGGPTTSEERITLDAQDDASMLILNDAEPGIVRLLRCPAPSDPGDTGTDSGPLELEPFDLARVRDAGIESIGCSMRPGQDVDSGIVFFANGEDGAFMVIDGASIALSNSTAPDAGVIPNIEADLTYSENGYAATFVTVGEASPDSIESTEQAVTLAVATPDGRRTRIDGIISCGV
ncbi:MAG: hypothetical protein WA964_19615 [Ilumatobacter sp.]|uniref:hypothetical protein n=1 Tax=Ilumatobacter sp. TaxID=1967498 RepID=UPI003C764476